MSHEELVEAANDAINAVFGDTSVPQSLTRVSLLGLKENIEIILDTLKDNEEEDV